MGCDIVITTWCIIRNFARSRSLILELILVAKQFEKILQIQSDDGKQQANLIGRE